MHVEIINGKEIKTNYGEGRTNYLKGNESGLVCIEHIGMTQRDFLEKKAEEGYKRITFYELATAVKGYTKSYAKLYK